MRRSDIRSGMASDRLLPDQNTETPQWYGFWSGLSLVWSRLESRPAFVFLLFSFVFGSAISVVVPPLRGPDEIAHFLRIYSYTRGGLLPAAEVGGRKGIFVEHELYTQLSFFKNAGERFARNREQGLRYSEIMKEYPQPGGTLHEEGQATKFMPFAGTEGYNGAFVLIAMLPVSIYNRSVLSADGAALSYALVITALCFSAVQRYGRVWERSLWMTLCALSKQPQIVFVLLELMGCRMTELRRRWSSLALVAAPGFILSPLWVLAVSADIAAWRLLEGETHPREHFDPLWKLAYMWDHPLHFPLAAWTAVTVWGDRLWPELIGILGWQDILLPASTYIVLTVLLLVVPLQKLNLDGAVRARVAAISALAVLAYVVTVYLIFFLTYTPLNVDHVRGVQGRYFVIALPMAAIFLASMTNIDLPRSALATTAITGSMLSGITSFHALLGAHWSVP